jgi:hypothetical protein
MNQSSLEFIVLVLAAIALLVFIVRH